MKPVSTLAAFSFILLSAFPTLAVASNLTILTTLWPPYVTVENGQAAGLATEIIQAVVNQAGIRAKIEIYPWKRAISTVMKQKDILIYPLIRIKLREDAFDWVAPIFTSQICLYKLKKRQDINLAALDDAKKYRTSVLRGAAMHQFLNAEGFIDASQLVILGDNRRSVELLFRERVDLIADDPRVIRYEAEQLGYSIDKAEKVRQLFENEAYMAFGKGSSATYITPIKNAFEQLRIDGTISAILDRHE